MGTEWGREFYLTKLLLNQIADAVSGPGGSQHAILLFHLYSHGHLKPYTWILLNIITLVILAFTLFLVFYSLFTAPGWNNLCLESQSNSPKTWKPTFRSNIFWYLFPGRRVAACQPATMVPTQSPLQPVVMEGGWTEQTQEEMKLMERIRETEVCSLGSQTWRTLPLLAALISLVLNF